jgi:hypothetical protein
LKDVLSIKRNTNFERIVFNVYASAFQGRRQRTERGGNQKHEDQSGFLPTTHAGYSLQADREIALLMLFIIGYDVVNLWIVASITVAHAGKAQGGYPKYLKRD